LTLLANVQPLLKMKLGNFEEHYTGTLRGILKEEKYLELAGKIGKHPGTWYGLSFHEQTLQAVEMNEQEVSEKLLGLHQEIVQKNYVSARYPYTYFAPPEEPLLIKLYHPGECGGSCSTSAPAPWWVFTRIKPTGEELQKLRPKTSEGFFSRFKRA